MNGEIALYAMAFAIVLVAISAGVALCRLAVSICKEARGARARRWWL